MWPFLRPKCRNRDVEPVLLLTRMESCRPVAPEMRPGDVVAILSNGGFGGIYEKLPQRLKAPGGRRFGQPSVKGVRQSVNRSVQKRRRIASFLAGLIVLIAIESAAQTSRANGAAGFGTL